MLKLLKIELKKYFSYANFWVIFGLHAALFVLSIFIVANIKIDMQGFDINYLWTFPEVWNTITWIASWFNLILAILIIVITGNEFSFKTFRKTHIDGLSRHELVAGKVIVMLMSSIYCFVLVFVTILITGFIKSGFTGLASVFENSHYLFIYTLQAFAYMSIGFFVAVIVKNTGLSILFFLLYFFPVEPILRGIIPDVVSNYFPMKIISNLTPAPELFNFGGSTQFTTSINGSVVTQQPAIAEATANLMWLNVIFALIYIIAFLFTSKMLIEKRNL